MNIVSVSRDESMNQGEHDQLVRGFTHRPQTQDDLFTSGQNESDEFVNVTEDTDNTFLLNVIANDRGRKPDSIWSLDDGVDFNVNGLKNLLDQDVVGEINSSALGAQISVTADGKVAYTFTEALHAELQSLAEGEFVMDTFVYALRLVNGTLSLATATVKISGKNDVPKLTGTMVDLSAGTVGESYFISTNDLLSGFSDVDDDLLSVSNLTATHGTLTVSTGGWIFIPDQHFSGVVDLSYVVTDQHGGSVDAVQHFNLEPVADTTAPLLITSNPRNNSTFKIDNDIQLNFDEMVMAGSGDIIISSGLDTRTIDINDTSQVVFNSSKNRVTINPTDDLIPNTSYNIQIAEGVITDANGNAYAGISGETTLDFTTAPAEPLLIGSDPGDDSTFKVDNDIQLYFDKTVVPGSGDIIISSGSDTRTIDISDTSQVVFNSSKNRVTINPTDDLLPNTSYNIQIAEGVITDANGNAYVGISDETTFNFTTISSDPLLISSNPWDEAVNVHISSNLHLYFDEAVTAGSGNIIISNGSDTRTIDINDASQVTFDGHSGIFINPLDDLIPDTSYNIQLVSGVITDFAGNPYAGINDSTTLNFITTADPSFITMAGVIDPGVGISM